MTESSIKVFCCCSIAQQQQGSYRGHDDDADIRMKSTTGTQYPTSLRKVVWVLLCDTRRSLVTQFLITGLGKPFSVQFNYGIALNLYIYVCVCICVCRGGGVYQYFALMKLTNHNQNRLTGSTHLNMTIWA